MGRLKITILSIAAPVRISYSYVKERDGYLLIDSSPNQILLQQETSVFMMALEFITKHRAMNQN